MFAVAQHLGAIDEDVAHAGRILVRPLEGGVIADRHGAAAPTGAGIIGTTRLP